MASVGPGNHVVVVLHVGGSNTSYINTVLQREPRTGNALFPYGIVLPSEDHVDAAVRELFEETGMTMAVQDLTMLSSADVRVPFLEGKYQLFYVYAESVHVPYVNANLRTRAKVEQAVISQSTL
jgi:8-oxo-dGTP pyrophosphatase MutT (NUDIX family)